MFAAFDIATGTVAGQSKPRYRHQEFLSILYHAESNVPADLDVHIIMDNYGAHKHPRIRAWFAHHPPFHCNFTTTYASWLNQVERRFGLIKQRAIKRSSFGRVKDIIERIERYIAQNNVNLVTFK